MKIKKLNESIEKHKFSKNIKRYGLLLSYDDRKHPVLNVCNDNGSVLLRKFCGRFDLDKFLVEAVLLRMSIAPENVKEVRKAYNNLIDFLNDEDRVSENAIL